jgi:hypothetical protein
VIQPLEGAYCDIDDGSCAYGQDPGGWSYAATVYFDGFTVSHPSGYGPCPFP